ncbi:hypothetical protein BFP70_13575 [Thioclava sp. SK-1]|uniref:tellurite resistance TerB family protein n=1 Tax=Thioclava sp. SK-1 TaxID=1889770 RepID=UPI000826FF2F|nr:TerB family tellurite resistance protein [Thioclava sp. SK-1]OCX62828.1 hypothetical protein BFP70_13575 [Thioclava sp. SK-1]
MIRSLFAALTAPDPNPLDPTDAELALAALLVRLARTDETYSEVEKTRIDRVLAARQGLAPAQASALRHEAEIVESDAPDTVRFTRALKEKIPYDDRIKVIEALWEVALADGQRDADEDALIRMAAKLLGVNDVDSALARQRVAKREM